ncbi:Glycosyl transferases group 1 [Luteibacter sp. UNCMF331Sha3.1]|uniref:glycosyltransferase n=1 Tax=Luteibacter sp. UNCMF331Sha3.1 TaxID=1502760 RepID=UPI0008B8C45D|nr:glycosyltransferase [Luteibacter sp. UNCMF331Sha3.1]SEM48899.1 Glycosyl transferases group 1 [Luteibacter sp. UNCMF331Sha3.1]
MASIHLIAWDNGRGLTHDSRLFETALRELGHEVTVSRTPRRAHGLPWRAWWAILAMRLRWLTGRGPRRYDLGLTIEHVHPAYLRMSRRNAFVPNPEWLSRRDRRHLHRFDGILCKTESARAAFDAEGLSTAKIGFVSTDCRREGVPRDREFLHLAGGSRMKGTERLLAVWRRHPEWPTLHLYQSPHVAADDRPTTAPNIDHRITFVADIEDVRRLQNTHRFHLCLSEAEGWGHYIVEAMSCGAVVLATDGAPMNELVTDERGIRVAARENGTMNAATLWQFDEEALEACVEHAMRMSDSDVEALGGAARRWYETNQDGFPARLGRAIDDLLRPR